eukprot:TRINITY_DN8049_c0_g1_i1.p2 TRINITY_DN8049_c0_g1~~TRINITY_DN8049_c0_g1_i1.p2  ORF type:complete len:142 (-),score=13.75 TRINITY_DN8049_c0_g1_i1:120-503(-)
MIFKQVLFVPFLFVAAAEIYQSENLEISGRQLKALIVNPETTSQTTADEDGNTQTSETSSTSIELDGELLVPIVEGVIEATKGVIGACLYACRLQTNSRFQMTRDIIDKLGQSSTHTPTPESFDFNN